MGEIPAPAEPRKPENLAEANPSLASVVRGSDAFELLGQVPELKANVKALERVIDGLRDETRRSLDRLEISAKEQADRSVKALDTAEARLTKSIDYQRDQIKELGDKINGVNWKLALAAGAVMVGSANLTLLLPIVWKTIIH